LAAAIKEANAEIDVELIAGKGGIFDVKVGGELVYSKFDTDRFPTNEEIVAKLS
jgi:selT/selW/selH-like putative selenoprotein